MTEHYSEFGYYFCTATDSESSNVDINMHLFNGSQILEQEKPTYSYYVHLLSSDNTKIPCLPDNDVRNFFLEAIPTNSEAQRRCLYKNGASNCAN